MFILSIFRFPFRRSSSSPRLYLHEKYASNSKFWCCSRSRGRAKLGAEAELCKENPSGGGSQSGLTGGKYVHAFEMQETA